MTPNEKDDILKIDLAHLEKDLAEHARLVRIWGDKLAEAEFNCKHAKNKLRLVKAELSRVVRSNPGKYNIVGRATEDATEDVVVTMSSYKEPAAELIQAEYDRDIIKNMVIALHERGEAMGYQAKLHGQMYWAKPQTNEEYSRHDVMTEAAEEAMPKKGKK